MSKVLFMPLLQISSGHHQVADALVDHFKSFRSDIQTEKVDILKYGYGTIEKVVSTIYLNWIQRFPNFYRIIYRKSLLGNIEIRKRYLHYELLFLQKMKKLVNESKPDVIICTHSLPSYILDRLKAKGEIDCVIVNAYTDFFINNLWGINEVNYHFVADQFLKEKLVEKGVQSERIFVTGIPIHQKILQKSVKKHTKNFYQILITGGSLGVGKVNKFIKTLKPTEEIRYIVLCGKNKLLYNFIKDYNHPYIKGLPYLECRDKMNLVYYSVDGIITKPGGVTISECLHKQIPIFINESLPGQEEMNLNHLKSANLVFKIENAMEQGVVEKEILAVLKSKKQCDKYFRTVKDYNKSINREKINQNINQILSERIEKNAWVQ